ncbi:hypothetical protein M7I_0874 [Glarea lozoyensis 74030]|uniref:Uncharacterized protein n=1 Tax=Glarea lozoyensis (strain ATCC 74030 / MF5533) TaxID=1104152 RepID=H0EEJ6_GLAL7|nr:hypothetical protein M7I_0874 [Glarea lozoyensis 74030]
MAWSQTLGFIKLNITKGLSEDRAPGHSTSTMESRLA